MPDCDYCGESFGDQSSHDRHLKSEHADELGPIDRRRLGMADDDGGVLSGAVGPVAFVAVIALAGGVVAYVTFFSGGASGGDGPTNVGSVHYHGTMEVVVLGERVDFSQSQYQLQADAFHYEGGDGSQWHVHAQGVTLAWALDSLGIGVTDSSVTYQGTTYRNESAEYVVVVRVNGQDVDPGSYVLQPEDSVRIAVREAN